MSRDSVAERDWKLFKSRIADWQEAYMQRLLDEYDGIIHGEGEASEKFWALEKRIRNDKRHVGVEAEMSRSQLHLNMASLMREGAITAEDLDGFSDEMKRELRFLIGDFES